MLKGVIKVFLVMFTKIVFLHNLINNIELLFNLSSTELTI